MKHITKSFRPLPTINYARLKFTLILLMLLFAGKYVKADNAKPHVVYVDSKDSVKMQLQIQIAMQEIQIKDLMHEKQEIEKSNPVYFVYGAAIGLCLSACAFGYILTQLRK